MSLQSTFPEEIPDQTRAVGEAVLEKDDVCYFLGNPIYVTNVPQALLSVEATLVLGRSRWQVEMIFKLWKSDGQIDESRSENLWHRVDELHRAIQIVQRCLAGCRRLKCKSKCHTYEHWLKFNS